MMIDDGSRVWFRVRVIAVTKSQEPHVVYQNLDLGHPPSSSGEVCERCKAPRIDVQQHDCTAVCVTSRHLDLGESYEARELEFLLYSTGS